MSTQNKTNPTDNSVDKFIEGVSDENMRNESKMLLQMMSRISGKDAVMWGPSIIGFDSYHYKYDSGREGDMCVIGFSPRKTDLSIYLVDGVSRYENELRKLGKYRTGKSCLYLKKLSDVDYKILESIIKKSYNYTKSMSGKMHRVE
jgi:Domain of unknown function (DU1801)